jgi:hypothetical protein
VIDRSMLVLVIEFKCNLHWFRPSPVSSIHARRHKSVSQIICFMLTWIDCREFHSPVSVLSRLLGVPP